MDFETHDDLYRTVRRTQDLKARVHRLEDENSRLRVQIRDLWITIGYLHAAPPESLRRLALENKDVEDEAQMGVDNR